MWLPVFNSRETTAQTNDEIWNKMLKINITEGGSMGICPVIFTLTIIDNWENLWRILHPWNLILFSLFFLISSFIYFILPFVLFFPRNLLWKQSAIYRLRLVNRSSHFFPVRYQQNKGVCLKTLLRLSTLLVLYLLILARVSSKRCC